MLEVGGRLEGWPGESRWKETDMVEIGIPVGGGGGRGGLPFPSSFSSGFRKNIVLEVGGRGRSGGGGGG